MSPPGYGSSFLGLAFYLLLNISYTTAVFTNPGSPNATTKSGYSSLPTDEPSRGHAYTSFTVKSTGDIRYCKKCQFKKPDRAHHCSTCKRCVLKMDHHCPWLATCVGLHNYKAFLLFLVYTCAFCWLCFAVTGTWLWSEILSDAQYHDTLMPVNYILLAVLSGIIGLVLSGFTGWHIWLACKGRTTIESLEKTRYLAPIRNSMRQQFDARRNYVHSNGHGIDGEAGAQPSIGDQLREIHANALPGVTRPEEGEERASPTAHLSHQPQHQSSPARDSLLSNYDRYNENYEQQRERDRYQEYLDEKEDEQLPNAFDLGWKKNLAHLFGPVPWLWWLPVCNTTGDGWTWEANPRWIQARADIAHKRETRLAQEASGWPGQQSNAYSNGVATPRLGGDGAGQSYKQQEQVSAPHSTQMWSGRSLGPTEGTPMQSLSRQGRPMRHMDDTSPRRSGSDAGNARLQQQHPSSNWNDLPDDMLKPGSRGQPGKSESRSRSSGRRIDQEQWQNWDDRPA